MEALGVYSVVILVFKALRLCAALPSLLHTHLRHFVEEQGQLF